MSNKVEMANKGLTTPKIEQKGFTMPKPAPPSSYTQQSNNQTANQNSRVSKNK